MQAGGDNWQGIHDPIKLFKDVGNPYVLLLIVRNFVASFVDLQLLPKDKDVRVGLSPSTCDREVGLPTTTLLS